MFEDKKFIDLTRELSQDSVSWSGSCGFSHENKLDYKEGEGSSFRVQQIKMHAGIGTHMDAPSHCVKGGKNIADLELQNLIVPAINIDVSHKVDESYEISMQDIQDFEKKHGNIIPNSLVMFNTGWGKYWPNAEKYRNNYRFPKVSADVANYLVSCDVAGLAIDTLSPDRPNEGFAVHEAILGAGKYIIENICNLDQVPAMGSWVIALPIKFDEGTEAPMRVVAVI